jgi:tyrosinase
MGHQKLRTIEGVPVKAWQDDQSETTLKKSVQIEVPKQVMRSPKSGVKQSETRGTLGKVDATWFFDPERVLKKLFSVSRFRIRKNQKSLTPLEWNRFIYAIEALADSDTPAPTYQQFVKIHVDAMSHHGHHWGAHMALNFLTWHREYLAKLEAALMSVNPLVTIPYWNWIEDRYIPPALGNPSDLNRWGVTRRNNFNSTPIALASDYQNLMQITDFATFTQVLEQAPFHNTVHIQVGGTMGTSASPADPIFWLHHAFIDKIFHDWQILHPTEIHPNMHDILQPAPIMTRTNGEVWDSLKLSYVYLR